MLSFKDKVLAIAHDVGIPRDVFDHGGAAAVLNAACSAMGIQPKPGQTLPDIANALVEAVGCEVGPAPPPPPTAEATPPPLQVGPVPSLSSSAGRQRRQTAASSASSDTDFPRPPSATKQATVLQADGVAKFFMNKQQREAAARRQAPGEAVAFEEFREEVALEVVQLPSEKAPRPPPAKPVFMCADCGKIFHRPIELASHRLWKHPSAQQQTPWRSQSARRPPRPFHGKLSARLSVGSDGAVGVSVLVNGKSREQLMKEAEDNERAADAAKAERDAEAERRRHRAQRLRDAEQGMGEQRVGSAHRHQYTFKEKARLLDMLDKIYEDGTITDKGKAFEEDKRSRGCPYKTAAKWRKP